MSTLLAQTSQQFIDDIIASNGRPEPEDALVEKVVAFTNSAGVRMFGIVYMLERDKNRYERESPWCRDPEVIWRHKIG